MMPRMHDAPGRFLRHAGRPRRRRTRRADRRGRAADLPDLDLRPGRRRAHARRLRVRPLAEPDPRAARTRGRGARRRHARDRLRVRVGGHRGHRRARRARRGDRRRRRRLRRHVPLPRAGPSATRRGCPLRRPVVGARRALGGAHGANAAGLVRESHQPAAQARRHRGLGGHRPRSRGRGRTAAADRRRQHVRLAGHPAAADPRGRHRLPLRDEVPGRPLGHDPRDRRHLRRRGRGAPALPPERDGRGPGTARLLPGPARPADPPPAGRTQQRECRGRRRFLPRAATWPGSAIRASTTATARRPGAAAGLVGTQMRWGGGMVSFLPAAGGRHARTAGGTGGRDRRGERACSSWPSRSAGWSR